MRRVSGIIAALAVLAACILGAWYSRGIFDETFMLEGVFHVTNASGRDIGVVLSFPSGKRVAFPLGKGGSHTFVMHDTGEGNLGVGIDGGPVQPAGYLTSLNDPCIVAVGDSTVSFSQLFPGSVRRLLGTEPAE